MSAYLQRLLKLSLVYNKRIFICLHSLPIESDIHSGDKEAEEYTRLTDIQINFQEY